jgi:hypothetical protein
MASFPHKLAAMTRRAITVLALGCALSIGGPALGAAASGGTAAQAITDCNDRGQLTQQFSPQVLRQALAQMPADVREYTDCFDVIERQLFKQLGSTKSAAGAATSSSGSSFLPTWLLIVIVLLALAAITFGALAIRRRGTPADAGGSSEVGGSGEPGGSSRPREPGDSERPGGSGGPGAT